MIIKERLGKMVDGNWLFILVPQTEHLMCGTQKVGIMHDGLIKVLYEDGTIEEYVQEGR